MKITSFGESHGPLIGVTGGILGGISTGTDLIINLAIKPTPSISKPQKTVDVKLKKKSSK